MNFQKQQAKKSKEEKYNMLTEVIEIIKETFSPSIEVTGETTIKNDLQLDSFDIINLTCIFEDRYKVKIDDIDLYTFVTVKDICDYIAKK